MWIVTGIFFLSLAGLGLAALLSGPQPSELQRDFSDSLKEILKASLVALLTGRAVMGAGRSDATGEEVEPP